MYLVPQSFNFFNTISLFHYGNNKRLDFNLEAEEKVEKVALYGISCL